MKLERLSIQGFLSYGEEPVVVDLSDISYAAIVGRNGAGKSSIPLAVTWALFGTLRVSGNSDSVVNDECESAAVELDFTMSGQGWRVSRSKNYGGGSTVRLYERHDDDLVQYGDHLNKTAQDQIYRIVGMDEDAWYSIVLMDYFTSGGGTRFTKADSGTRRSILMTLTPELHHWSRLEADAVERRRTLARDLERLDATINDLDERTNREKERLDQLVEEMDDLEPERVEREYRSLTGKIRKLSDLIAAQGSEHKEAIAALRAERSEHERDVERLRSELRVAESARDSYVRRQREVETLQNAIQENIESAEDEDTSASEASMRSEKALKKVSSKNTALKRLQRKRSRVASETQERAASILSIESQISLLSERDHDHSSTCPLCEGDLSEKRATSLLKDLKIRCATEKEDRQDSLKILENLDKEESDIREEIRSLERQISDADSFVKTAHRNAERYRKDATRSQEMLDQLRSEMVDDDHQAEITKRTEIIEDAQRRWVDTTLPALERKVDEASDDARTAKDREKLKDLSHRQSELDNERSKIASLKGGLKAAQEAYRRDIDDFNDKVAQGDAIEARLKRVEWLVKAFQPKGIPSMLLDAILSSIEDEQNRILSSIPGSEGMRVEFRQTRETKTAGSKEVLDIIVHTPSGHERPIESFSSGELVRLTISNLFAMISTFKRRFPNLVSTLFLDEPLGPLDSEAVPAFIEVLRAAMNAGTVENVMVVTHDQRVIDALPQRIEVSRSPDGGSSVTVAG